LLFGFGRVTGHRQERFPTLATLQVVKVKAQQISRLVNVATMRALLEELNAKIQWKREKLANENRAPAPAIASSLPNLDD
jgi:hypothetical protein